MTNHTIQTIASLATARLALNADWTPFYVASIYSDRYGFDVEAILAEMDLQRLVEMGR
jgi:hypothetical protein